VDTAADLEHPAQPILSPWGIAGLPPPPSTEPAGPRHVDQSGSLKAPELGCANRGAGLDAHRQHVLSELPILESVQVDHRYKLRRKVHGSPRGLPTFPEDEEGARRRKEDQMRKNQFDKPVPALAIAVGLAFLTHQANAKAARAVGVPAAAVALLAAGIIAVAGLRS
jgi:hypothetical protein